MFKNKKLNQNLNKILTQNDFSIIINELERLIDRTENTEIQNYYIEFYKYYTEHLDPDQSKNVSGLRKRVYN